MADADSAADLAVGFAGSTLLDHLSLFRFRSGVGAMSRARRALMKAFYAFSAVASKSFGEYGD